MKKKMFIFLEKMVNGYHTISIYENCMTSVFFTVFSKFFSSDIEIAPVFFCQAQIEFSTQTNIFQKTILHANYNFLSA